MPVPSRPRVALVGISPARSTTYLVPRRSLGSLGLLGYLHTSSSYAVDSPRHDKPSVHEGWMDG